MYLIGDIRKEFPGLDTPVQGQPLIYLDNTATTQTPAAVVEALRNNYYNAKANVHRGVHTLSQIATARMEETRDRAGKYINAREREEIIFTSGATESINLVASSLGELIPEGAEIVLTVMEHHANIVPWQLLQKRKNLKINVVDINERGELDLGQYAEMMKRRPALAAFCHVSNVLGTVNPVKEMTRIAKEYGAYVLIDGAQGPGHVTVDVQDIGCDFYVFSAHKMYGPTGVGVLYGRRELLEQMPPYQGGGEMIKHVSFNGTTFADLPFKFEAGTPDFTALGAFKESFEFLESPLYSGAPQHETSLLHHAESRMREEVAGIRFFGEAPGKSAILSFMLGDVHPYDVGMLLDGMGIAVRTGHHCAQPLMERLGIPGTVRAGFACYNTMEETDKFVDAVKRVAKIVLR